MTFYTLSSAKGMDIKMKKSKLKIAIVWSLASILIIGLIFLSMSCLWIVLTGYTYKDFGQVLCLCIKNAGTYSVLLVGVVITIFFQIYSKEKEMEGEEKIKIEEVGYYTLAFPLPGSEYEEKFVGDKMVVEIQNEEDFLFDPIKEDKDTFHILIKFLTSKNKSTNLKNIMAFNEKYFEKNKKDILMNYYKYCEKIEYSSPLYCATKPINENYERNKENRKRYFWIILKCHEKTMIKNIWFSAVTEEGFLLFIKTKLKLEKVEEQVKVTLLQQTTYYKGREGVVALYR